MTAILRIKVLTLDYTSTIFVKFVEYGFIKEEEILLGKNLDDEIGELSHVHPARGIVCLFSSSTLDRT